MHLKADLAAFDEPIPYATEEKQPLISKNSDVYENQGKEVPVLRVTTNVDTLSNTQYTIYI